MSDAEFISETPPCEGCIDLDPGSSTADNTRCLRTARVVAPCAADEAQAKPNRHGAALCHQRFTGDAAPDVHRQRRQRGRCHTDDVLLRQSDRWLAEADSVSAALLTAGVKQWPA